MALKKIESLEAPPRAAIIQSGFGAADYIDAYKIVASEDGSIDTILNKAFKLPAWTLVLLKMRNSLVSSFGLKTDQFISTDKTHYEIGSKAALFTVIDRNENEIVMGEADKHLNFRTSVRRLEENGKISVCLTTIVKYNNAWGRVYFFFVKPFHRAIMKSLLKRNF